MSNPGVKRTVIILVTIVVIIVALLFARAFRAPELSTEQLAHWNTFLYQEPRPLVLQQLVDQHNKPFTQERLQGRWTLVFFGFTYCPDICPTTMALLNRLTKRLKQTDVQVVMASVDPERDTPEQLAGYVSHFNPEFVGITGSEPAMVSFATQLNAVFTKVPQHKGHGGADSEDYLVSHSSNILLLNPEGKQMGFFRAPHRMANLENAMKAISQVHGS